MGLFALELQPSGALLENSDVRITRALEKAHVKGNFHDHKVNRVMVYLQSGTQRFEYQDGRQPQVFDWKAGQVVWSPAEGMHSPEVVSDAPFNIIEMELKKPGAGKAASGPRDALKLDGKHFKLEFENDQVRVLRMKLGPHEATPVLEQSRNSVAIFLTDAAARTTDSRGVVASVTHKAGDVSWETPVTQKIENVSDVPLEMVLVELSS
jgi:mannose-6-phosphate isomerase-like protein (cupin superfamily)